MADTRCGFAAVVVKDVPRRVRHWTIKNEVDLVGAAAPIGQGLLPAAFKAFLPFEPGRHVEKVLDRYRFLPVVEVGDGAIGEKIQQRMAGTVQQALLDRNRRQGANDSLGGGVDGVRNVGGIGSVIGVQHDPAVPHQQQAVEILGFSKVEQFGEFGRINALLFRRGGLPLPGRPDGLCRRALSGCSAATDRNRQDDRAQRGCGKSPSCAQNRLAHAGFSIALPKNRTRKSECWLVEFINRPADFTQTSRFQYLLVREQRRSTGGSKRCGEIRSVSCRCRP